MNLETAWDNARTAETQFARVIAGTHYALSLAPAAARNHDMPAARIVSGENLSALVEQGCDLARRQRVTIVRLRLRQGRGRPQERVLAFISQAAPKPVTRNGALPKRVTMATSRPASKSKHPATPPTAINVDGQILKIERKLLAEKKMTATLQAHAALLKAQLAAQRERTDELHARLLSLEAQECSSERIEALASAVEGLRRQFRVGQGLPPSPAGLSPL